MLDKAKLDVYLKLCGILPFELDDRPEIEDQIFRPISLGGRGLSRFSEILDISFVASQAMCAPLIKDTFAGESKDSRHFSKLKASLAKLEVESFKASLGFLHHTGCTQARLVTLFEDPFRALARRATG